MKVALIPPVPDLHLYGNGMFHLLLSHLLQDKRYTEHYMNQRARGAYLVLDNSAHEQGVGDDPEVLLFNAYALDAQEMVVPDVLDDGPGTVEKAVHALETWFDSATCRKHIHELAPSLMYVPQGRNLQEWEWCLRELVNLHNYCARKYKFRSNFVIGMSKDYEKWPGGIMNLLDQHIVPLVTTSARNGQSVQIHLLGWGRNLWELEAIGKKHPGIRSTDSAKPFVYAASGVNLREWLDSDPPIYPTRSRDYFRRRVSVENNPKVIDNINVFKACAAGDRRTA